MRWILEHPDEAETMGQHGRKTVEEKYNWDHEAAKLMAFMESLRRAGFADGNEHR